MSRLIHLFTIIFAIVGSSLAATGPSFQVPVREPVKPPVQPRDTVRVPPDAGKILPRGWDFEDGTLQGFVHEPLGRTTGSNAFSNQPTFGDNVSTSRALNTGGLRLPPNPCDGLVLDALTTCEFGAGATFYYLTRLRSDLDRLRIDLAGIGGNYWDTPFPIGKQGLYWIGTYENRRSRRMGPRLVPGATSLPPPPWGTVQRDVPTGRLVSPEVELQHDYFHLLVGGGCSNDVGVYLQSRRPAFRGGARDPAGTTLPGIRGIDPSASLPWQTLRDAAGNPIVARGYCVENMVRVTFDIRHLRGTRARILIEDRASGSWGHINVDDIWLTNTAPRPNSRQTDPVFGIADLHAHLMNEKTHTAYAEDGRTPEARLLWGSAFGPIDELRGCNDTHTTNDHDFTRYEGPNGSTYTLCRDVCLGILEAAGLPDLPGDAVDQDSTLGFPVYHNTARSGFPDFVNAPTWYAATHQQMHGSWVNRAYRGGLRLMIATVGNSEVLSFAMTREITRPFSSDQDAVALQIPAIKEFARQNSAWTEVAYTPADARRIINAGKLALVIGVELDHVMDSCSADVTSPNPHLVTKYGHPARWAEKHGLGLTEVSAGVTLAQMAGANSSVVHVGTHPSTCSETEIENRLDALFQQGVRHVIPLHFSNNMLGGYAITSDLFTASAIFGDAAARPPALMPQEEVNARFRGPMSGVTNTLSEVKVPIWARIGPKAVADPNIIPEGIGRTIAEYFSGKCIEDDGWRVVFGILTGGASEAACATSKLTEDLFEEARTLMPFEGATDSPFMVPAAINLPDTGPRSHLNALGLTRDEGRTFIRAMMRRGMLIDLQHASEAAKGDILEVAGSYPVMASHGGVQGDERRRTENELSRPHLDQIYSPPGGLAGGLVGLGTQSSNGLVGQIRRVATGGLPVGEQQERTRQTRGVALGTDLNGLDWHAPPRFGKFAFYHAALTATGDPRRELYAIRPTRFDRKVNYLPYPEATNPWAWTLPTCEPPCTSWTAPVAAHPQMTPLQIVHEGRVTRTFDINFDGLAHYGLIPDFLQELSVLGTAAEEMGSVFRSAEGLLRMWEETCALAYAMPSPPSTLARGCGGPR